MNDCLIIAKKKLKKIKLKCLLHFISLIIFEKFTKNPYSHIRWIIIEKVSKQLRYFILKLYYDIIIKLY